MINNIRVDEMMMKFYSNMHFIFPWLDIDKLKILGIEQSWLYYIIFSSLFIICYLFVHPLIAILVARHTVKLLTYLMSSLLMIVSCLLLLQLPNLLPTTGDQLQISNSSLIFKSVLLAIGTLGMVIAGIYYTKHLFNVK